MNREVKSLNKVICWGNTIWMTIINWPILGVIVTGHKFVEIEEAYRNHESKKIEQILECKRCGYRSIGYLNSN